MGEYVDACGRGERDRRHERAKGRGDALREEIARLDEQGRLVEAQQARRTLREAIDTGVAV